MVVMTKDYDPWEKARKSLFLGRFILIQEWKWKKVKSHSCVRLCDAMECSLPHSSIHGIFQARVLEWSHHFTSLGTESQKTHGLSYHLNKINPDTSSSSLSAINLLPIYQESRGDPVWNISIPCQPCSLWASLSVPVSTSFLLVSSLDPLPVT